MFVEFLMALVLTVGIIVLIKPLAIDFGLVDKPCIRKCHDGVVPLIGGVVIYSALAITALSFVAWQDRGGMGLLGLGLPILLVGAVDDRWNLSPFWRFLVEIFCCLLAALHFGVRLDTLGALLPGGVLTLGWLALPFTVLGLVGVINALNMTDGVDGLAGGLALLIFSALAWLAYRVDADITAQLLTLAGCLLGFLFFNSRFFGRSKAAIFMGDGGTLFVGFALGWYLILLSQGKDAVITPVAALWLFAFPLFDTVSVMIRRVRRGHSPFRADREHLHHIFLLAGFGVNRSVLAILGLQGLCIGYAFASLAFGIPEWFSFALFLGLFAAYYWAMNHAWKLMKRLKSFREWAGFEDRRTGAMWNTTAALAGAQKKTAASRKPHSMARIAAQGTIAASVRIGAGGEQPESGVGGVFARSFALYDKVQPERSSSFLRISSALDQQLRHSSHWPRSCTATTYIFPI